MVVVLYCIDRKGQKREYAKYLSQPDLHKNLNQALAGMAQLAECRPIDQKVMGAIPAIPDQGTYPGCRFHPP